MMREGARTAATVTVLVVVLLVGASWGWSALTQPFPGKVDVPTCVDRTVAAGEKLYPDEVVVSVLNAGTREGLAGRTMQLLTDEGFGQGDSGNAPKGTDVAVAEIWADDPGSPAAALVASRFGSRVQVVRRDTSTIGAGVVVVVGDGFDKLHKGKSQVTADTDAQVCGPPQT